MLVILVELAVLVILCPILTFTDVLGRADAVLFFILAYDGKRKWWVSDDDWAFWRFSISSKVAPP